MFVDDVVAFTPPFAASSGTDASSVMVRRVAALEGEQMVSSHEEDEAFELPQGVYNTPANTPIPALASGFRFWDRSGASCMQCALRAFTRRHHAVKDFGHAADQQYVWPEAADFACQPATVHLI